MIHTFKDPSNPKITKGFQMTFENGNTISVMFGKGNYCANKMEAKDHCANAEVMIWDKDNNTIPIKGEEVEGWCSPERIVELMNKASKAKK
jgi:hypothetical protein